MLNNYSTTAVCFYVILLSGMLVFGVASPMSAQCTDPSISLPDQNQPVANPSVSYCVNIPINPSITGNPIGFSMELEHTFIGDLSIRVNACGETLMLVTRPGGGSCDPGSPFGSSASVNGYFTFSEGGGPNPDNGLAFGGGDYGLSGDPCNVNTVNSFAELVAACGGGSYTLELCITDHANVDVGFAGSIAPIFPGVPPTVCGCTDPLATNYDPTANFDDGTCIYPPGCGDFFYDSGGPNGPYQNQENTVTTICPDIPGDLVEVTFSVFDLENVFDDLTIYDGPNTGSPVIGSYSGNNNPGTVTSSHPSGCLTFVFDSDFSGTDPGWVAFVDCVQPCIPPGPPVATPVTVCQGESAALSAAPCAGGTIRWYTSPSGGNPIASGPVYNTPVLNANTTYYVACDIGDCASDRTAVAVTVTPPVTPALMPIGPFCQGAPSVLLSNVQDGVLGTWSGPGVNSGLFTPSNVGIVALTFTPAPGECAEPAVLVVETLQNPVPDITGPDAICDGNPEFLTASGNFASYLWNTGETTQAIPIFGPGTYSVTVTTQPGNCIGESSFTVSESPAPVPVISGDTQICPGESTTLSVSGGFNSYAWSDGSTGPTLSVNTPGTVVVTVTDATGCEGSAMVDVAQISLPDPQISGPATLCPDIPGTLSIVNAGDYDSFSWSTFEDSGQITIPGPGTYSVTVGNQGCETEAVFTVAEDAALPPSLDGVLNFCDGAFTSLSVSPSYTTYSWSTGGNAQTEVVNTGGNVGVTVTDANGCVAETSVAVTANALPDVQVTGDEEICTGSFGVLSVVNGASYTDILWNNSETDPVISVSAPGTYSVTATDLNGCVGTASFDVEEVALPNASISGMTSYCTGTSTILTASPSGLSYQWSNGVTTQNATVNTPGTTFVTVTNASGCQSVASIEVTEVTELAPEISGPTTFCEGEFIFLVGPVGFSSYQWSDNSQNQELEVTEGGTYSLTVTDANGCTGSASYLVTENTLPDAAISGALSFCAGDTLSLAGPAGMDEYDWSDNSSGPVLELTTPGTYSLTVLDDNGCENSASVTVAENPLPVPEISGPLSFCADTSAVLSLATAYEAYQWSDGSSASELTVDTSGTVMVTVTDGNGCQNSTAVEVEEHPLPTFSITGPQAFCEGESVALGVDGVFESYEWSTGADTDSTVVLAPGTVSLTVADINGCSNTNAVTLVENELPVAEIGGELSFCAGTSTTLTAPDSLSGYFWENGETTQSITVTTAGTYSLTVTDAFGCTAAAEVAVTEDALPVPEIQGIAAFCPDSTVTLSLNQPYQSYQWSTGAVSAFVEVSTAEVITVEVANEAGCTGTDTLETQIFPAPQVGILGSTAFCAGDTIALTADADFPVYDWNTGAESGAININTPGDYSLTVTDVNGCPASTSITITENALPAPEITGPAFFCAGDSTVLEATSGFGDYLWSDGTTQSSLLVTAQGTSALTVTDANGCQGETSFFIDEIALPAPQINGTPAFCPGTSATLSASAIFSSYEWSTGDTTGTTTITAPGPVALTVTNAQGCVGGTMVEVSEYTTQIPQIDGVPNFCPGTSTTLTAEDSFTTYQWSNNTTTPQVEVTEPGTIEVTVTDTNGCMTSNSIEVGVYAVLVPEIGGPVGFCTDTMATLSAGTGYAEYEWSTGSDTESITIDSGGIYRVTVTDANGCITEDNYQLLEYNLPTVAIGGSSSFCPGGFATLNAGGDYTAYQWSTGSDAASIEVNQEGAYGLTVTDANGCTNDASLQVTQQDELSPVISGPLQFCPGTETQLSAGAGYSVYEWQDGAETIGITVAEPGTYSVYVEDASGCSGTASVDVSLFPEAEVDISAPEGFCVDESAILTAAGSSLSAFEWEDGSFDPVRTVTEPGTYTVFATDVNGCRDTANYNIVAYPLPEFDIEGTPFFCAGESTELQASGTYPSYTWNGTPGEATFEAGSPGLYVLEVADSNGCQNQASLEVERIALPVADAGMPDTLTCTVNEVAIGGNGTSSGAAFVYQWTGPGITASIAGLPSPTVSAAGTYELMVTDTVHGCVSEPALAEVPLSNDVPVVSLSVNDTLDCATNSLVIDGSASSSWPELTYQWEDLNGSVLATNTNQLPTEQPGFYVLLLEDAETGCSERDTVQVIQDIATPTAEAGPGQRLDCAITSVLLSASGSTQGGGIQYTWLDENQQTVASVDSVLVGTPGTYTLQVVNTQNSCQSEDEVVITQDVEAPVADAGEPQQIDCLSPTANLNGAGSQTGQGITHQWAFGQQSNVIGTGLDITVDTAGTYFFIVTDEDNHCQSIATVAVSEIGTAPTALLTSANGPTCFGDANGSILISSVEGGTSPYLYSINGGAFDQQATFADLNGGVYNLVVQDAIGCEYETEILLEEGNDLGVEIIEQDINGQIQVGLGEVVELTAAVNIPEEEITRYLWQAADSLSCYDCPVTSVTPSASGLYQVQVTDLNGCTATDQVQLILNKKRRVYLPNVFSPNGDGANDIFYVQTGPEVVKIEAFEVYSRWGEPVFTVFNAPPNNPVFGWDGHYRGELMNGAVFTWFAKVEYVDGVVELFQGDVLLMR
ncbi:MAG: gliding motility-associated C-terminal domain-containing protein [Phaeodactylibacter sp.]|uniref:Ig-like domain-containing protein n=1 Tax=Phaeodactylibacter sp. TaxID=1940289 RepID=UPI0032EB1ECE